MLSSLLYLLCLFPVVVVQGQIATGSPIFQDVSGSAPSTTSGSPVAAVFQPQYDPATGQAVLVPITSPSAAPPPAFVTSPPAASSPAFVTPPPATFGFVSTPSVAPPSTADTSFFAPPPATFGGATTDTSGAVSTSFSTTGDTSDGADSGSPASGDPSALGDGGGGVGATAATPTSTSGAGGSSNNSTATPTSTTNILTTSVPANASNLTDLCNNFTSTCRDQECSFHSYTVNCAVNGTWTCTCGAAISQSSEGAGGWWREGWVTAMVVVMMGMMLMGTLGE